MLDERFDLVMQRIAAIENENTVDLKYRDYFRKVSNFILKIKDLCRDIGDNSNYRAKDIAGKNIIGRNLEDLKAYNKELYIDILGDNYQKSYANPTYASKQMGLEFGQMLSMLYTEIRGMIGYAYERNLENIVIYSELFVEIYNLFESDAWLNQINIDNSGSHSAKDDDIKYVCDRHNCEDSLQKQVREAIYWFMSDYCEIFVTQRIENVLDTENNLAKHIIMESDLSDIRYLFQYGEYITENEIEMAKYMNALSKKDIEKIAKTYVCGYKKGFELQKKDLSSKKIVDIRYPIGMERVVKAGIEMLRDDGLEVSVYRYALSSINKRQNRKIGYAATSANKQYEYDHRFDDALYLDKRFKERKIEVAKTAYERLKSQAKLFAGPILIETFGEDFVELKGKKEALSYDDKQQKIFASLNRENTKLTEQYINSDETSFTIIAFPSAAIGNNFKEIFEETIKINTLDSKLYYTIQDKLIAALDEAKYVYIKGKGDNKTDLKVALCTIRDKAKETNFENCLADVNIPLGEVFTSPKLAGTDGILHVTKVNLNEIEYIDLSLTFKNGCIESYSCKNFEDEKENKAFIKENLLQNHDTLPMGEFAIGTNTEAYVMGRKYNIFPKLPILIAEKTGPHFAIGDTCYSWSEDLAVYNPDGKEIIARENEISALRKTDIDKAYFSCHTDITIPYDELGLIAAIRADGSEIELIKDGEFVLEGTEPLNIPLKSL